MRQFLLGFFALCGHISIHASYANDATIKSQNLIKTKKNFNPRIVRKRCDAFDNADDLTRYISIHASYANDATKDMEAIQEHNRFQSTHRTQTMRQDIAYMIEDRKKISIHASYANDATKEGVILLKR